MMAGKPSKADRLPAELKEALAGLWLSQRYTLDQIRGWLDDLSAGKRSLLPPELAGIADAVAPAAEDLPSRSGLGRHFKGLDALAERLQRSRTIAEALIKKVGDAPEDRTARLNIEVMHSIITDLMAASGESEDGEAVPVTFDPQSVMFLARAMKDLSSAKKSDADLILNLRKAMQADLARKVDQVKGEARASPMSSEEALERVRRLYSGEA